MLSFPASALNAAWEGCSANFLFHFSSLFYFLSFSFSSLPSSFPLFTPQQNTQRLQQQAHSATPFNKPANQDVRFVARTLAQVHRYHHRARKDNHPLHHHRQGRGPRRVSRSHQSHEHLPHPHRIVSLSSSPSFYFTFKRCLSRYIVLPSASFTIDPCSADISHPSQRYSRPSKTSEFDYEFFVDFDAATSEQVLQVSKSLEAISKQVHVVGTGGVAGAASSSNIIMMFF